MTHCFMFQLYYRAKGAWLNLVIWVKVSFVSCENPVAPSEAEVLHIKVKIPYVTDYTKEPVWL